MSVEDATRRTLLATERTYLAAAGLTAVGILLGAATIAILLFAGS
jgi:uncharacterized membrane protein YidH (DUF202 family)